MEAENKENLENNVNTKENKSLKKTGELTKVQNIIFHIVAIICIALVGCAIAPKTLQNDTFYTIAIGEYIYNNGVSDLTQDLYSWHGLPYTYPHWLYDLGIFIVYNLFGHAGIYASTMILSSLLGISIYVLCNKKSKNKVISLVLTFGAMYLIKDFLAARAQLITFVLFALAVIFIEDFLETKKKRYAFLLILIPLIITNLHCAVFPFYFVLFLPYIGEYLLITFVDWDLDFRLAKLFFKIINKFSKKEEKKQKQQALIEKIDYWISERKRKRTILREKPYRIKVQKNHTVLLLIVIMAIAACTGFLNPAGDGAYTYLYKILQGNTTGSINEHLPLVLAENKDFFITLVVFLLVLIFTDSKIKLHDLFMLGGITFLSINSRRQVSMFAIFCMPILANLIGQMVEKYDRETFKKIERFVVGWFGTLVLICSFIIIATNLIKDNIRSDYIDTSSYPVEASDWMLSNLDVKNIKLYNEYNYGSYLLYRGIPVFIDSRCDLYTPEFNEDLDNEIEGRDIFSDALNIAGVSVNYENKFEQYGVTHVILYENAKLAMVLEGDSNYKKIYEEGNFVIFERLNAK